MQASKAVPEGPILATLTFLSDWNSNKDSQSSGQAGSGLVSTDDTHLDRKQGNYLIFLFVDYSSAFITTHPGRLFIKLRDMGQNNLVCLDPQFPHRLSTDG